ncbi:hypothetical protein D8674_018662 [Pyrus ussuriensis x Pyrus communis]|uniref:Uncharacterized protein n=1 Tax=Pyrus ussuriensis x Pyrus communis TaxID=2448454 RepID=A0A5N5GAS3_9ROSA|nr:uncharacterized protein LOC125474747 [Pyrus x bretschneideri]KAB2610630.1 hypothetical protein D8674_018662 [Pyrus ussuriensis x Pyrus communis]
MGNYLRSNNKIPSQDYEKHETAKEFETLEATKTAIALPSKLKQEKKSVRFNLQEDQEIGRRRGNIPDDSNSGGAVRISLVVTREELKQLLNYKKDSNHSSLEELMSALKSRGTRVSEINGTSGDDKSISSGSCWRPTLESIPEDQY